MECEFLENCSFFNKHMNTKTLACKGFISMYCKGPKMDDCKRKEIKKKTGKAPDADIMPNGQKIKYT